MARSPTNDLRLMLRLHLIENAAVSALVGGRVYGRHLEDAEAGDVLAQGALVVFAVVGGGARWHGYVSTVDLEIYTYSLVSSDAASEVYDAVYEALQHERLSRTGVESCGIIRETERPVSGYNDVHRAHFARGRWRIGAVSGA